VDVQRPNMDTVLAAYVCYEESKVSMEDYRRKCSIDVRHCNCQIF